MCDCGICTKCKHLAWMRKHRAIGKANGLTCDGANIRELCRVALRTNKPFPVKADYIERSGIGISQTGLDDESEFNLQ